MQIQNNAPLKKKYIDVCCPPFPGLDQQRGEP